jgi:nitrate reductase NapE component
MLTLPPLLSIGLVAAFALLVGMMIYEVMKWLI